MEETCSGWKGRPLTRVTSYISLPNVTNRSHEKQNVGPARWRATLLAGPAFLHIQLFRERSSEKVHATIRNLKDWHERQWTYVCECLRKATKVGLTATVSGTVYWSYPILPFWIVACSIFFLATLLEIAVNTLAQPASARSRRDNPSMHERCCCVGPKGYLFSHIKAQSSWLGGWSSFPGHFFSV